jgi:hypothetical protein
LFEQGLFIVAVEEAVVFWEDVHWVKVEMKRKRRDGKRRRKSF